MIELEIYRHNNPKCTYDLRILQSVLKDNKVHLVFQYVVRVSGYIHGLDSIVMDREECEEWIKNFTKISPQEYEKCNENLDTQPSPISVCGLSQDQIQ